MTSEAMPTNLPAGWDFAKVFGEDPSHPMIKASLDTSLLGKLAANDKPPSAKPLGANDVQLPQTDAGTTLQIFIGMLLTFAGLSLLAMLRRQTVRS